MTRREFPRSVKVAIIKRATRGGVTYCEGCGLPVKRWQIDHIIADAIGGQPAIENAQLLGKCCYGKKNPLDARLAAKTKRQEAKHLGARMAKQTIPSRPKPAKEPSGKLPLPRRMVDVFGRKL